MNTHVVTGAPLLFFSTKEHIHELKRDRKSPMDTLTRKRAKYGFFNSSLNKTCVWTQSHSLVHACSLWKKRQPTETMQQRFHRAPKSGWMWGQLWGGRDLKKNYNPLPPLRLQVVQKKNNSMTLLIAPHPSSPVSGTQDKPFSPHSRRSGAKLSEGHPASPLSLTWYIVFKIHVVLSLVFIAQRPRHLYLIAPKPLLGWEYWKLTLQTPQHSLFLHPKRIVFVAVKNVRFFFLFLCNEHGAFSPRVK